MGPVGRVSTEFFDPTRFLRTWNFSDLGADERARFYRETPQSDGTTLREYELFAVDRDIEIAPGVFFPAWTYKRAGTGPDDPGYGGRPSENHLRQPGVAPTHPAFSWLASPRDGTARCRRIR